MKRIVVILLAVIFLNGCSGENSELEQALSLRRRLLEAQGCAFEAVITADYGSKIYTFRMNCQGDKDGNLRFSVLEPDTISGITGIISQLGGKLTFDDQVLLFEMLADGQLSPVSAPWILLQSLRSGYIKSCGVDGDGIRIQLNDSYNEEALHVDVWTDATMLPIRGEIVYAGRRILSVDVENFLLM